MQALAAQCTDFLATVDNPSQRLHVEFMTQICMEIKASDKKTALMREIAQRHPGQLTYSTLRTKYYAWLKIGPQAFLDRRKQKQYKANNAWEQCYMMYCENHNRSNKGGWREMMADFRDGKDMDFGVGTWQKWWTIEHPQSVVPIRYPAGWVPSKARYTNLQRNVKENPDYLFQIMASRQGRGAAHKFLLPVLRTRAGLQPGQIYESDDVHVDLAVTMESPYDGKSCICRPQMFVIYDIASGFKIADVVRPQYPDTSTGKRNSLKEREYRYLNAFALTSIGFHKDGVRSVIEHGTTAIRPTLEEQINRIPFYGSLIKYDRSGIQNEAIHAGLFKGDKGGNFRMKAYCEQAHRGDHSRRAALPGQVGQDADHCPESHAALIKYEGEMLAAMDALDSRTKQLIMLDLLDWKTFRQINAELNHAISVDRDHRLEGWEGRTVSVWRRGYDFDWELIDTLLALPADEQLDRASWLRAHPEHRDLKQMNRFEVWQAGQQNLIKIPIYELPLLLDVRDAKLVRVKMDGTFSFQDKFYWGREKQVFHATCHTRSGFKQALIPEREYLFYSTPFHTEGGIIVDKDSGNVIGLAPFKTRAPYYDVDAIKAACGAQNADLARKVLPIRGRHMAASIERAKRLGNNADVVSGRKQPPLPQIETTGTINDLYERELVEDEW